MQLKLESGLTHFVTPTHHINTWAYTLTWGVTRTCIKLNRRAYYLDNINFSISKTVISNGPDRLNPFLFTSDDCRSGIYPTPPVFAAVKLITRLY